MNSKKILVSILIIWCLVISNNVFARNIQAKVQKSSVDINKLIEYNKYEQADAVLKSRIRKNPQDIEARALNVVLMAKQYKLDPAQKEVTKLLAKYPNNSDLHYAQGVIYMKRLSSSDMEIRNKSKEITEQAQEEFKKAIKLNSENYSAYNASGVAALNIGDIDFAEKQFKKALEIEPKYATATDNLGTVEYLNGNYEKAENLFKKSLSLNSKNPTAFFHLAQVSDKKRIYSKALIYLNNSLAINPNSSVAYNLMGEIYQKQGNEAAAINAFKKSAVIKPENPTPYLNLAELYERRADNEFALEQLKTALSADSRCYDAKLKIADISLKNAKYNQALKYYSSLVDVEKYKEEALKGIAATYFEQAKIITAKSLIASHKDVFKVYDEINEAIKLNPQDLELYLAKLKLEELTNRQEKSKETLTKIITSSSTELCDLVAKAEAYLTLNEYAQADKIYEAALNSVNTNQDKLYLAEILTYNGHLIMAKKVLENILMDDEKNKMALSNLKYVQNSEYQSDVYLSNAKYFKKHKNPVFVNEYLIKSLNFNPDNYNAAYLYAKCCEKEKDYANAVKGYKVYLNYNPELKRPKRFIKKISRLEKKSNKKIQKEIKKEVKQDRKIKKRCKKNL